MHVLPSNQRREAAPRLQAQRVPPPGVFGQGEELLRRHTDHQREHDPEPDEANDPATGQHLQRAAAIGFAQSARLQQPGQTAALQAPPARQLEQLPGHHIQRVLGA